MGALDPESKYKSRTYMKVQRFATMKRAAIAFYYFASHYQTAATPLLLYLQLFSIIISYYTNLRDEKKYRNPAYATPFLETQ